MKISVTQDDIDTGRRRRQEFIRFLHCPVAQAITRACGGGITAVVSQMEVHLVSGKRVKIIPLPHVAQAFISRFDHDWEPVTPFDFELDVDGHRWEVSTLWR